MRPGKLIIAALLLTILSAGAYQLSHQWLASAAPDRLTIYGNVDIREVQLGFRVAGRLQQMLAEEGDAVEAGDLLATLDEQPLREAVAVADAQVQQARAHFDRATAGSRPQEIQQARAAVAEAEAALRNLEQELSRQREMTAAKLSSQQQFDTALALRDQGLARLDATRERLELAIAGTRSEDIRAAEATFAAASARLDQATTQLDDTRLHAPAAGIVLSRVREPGSMVAVGAPVYTLALTDKTYVRAYVDEPRLGRVIPGTRVTVTTDSSEHVYSGQVGFVSPRAEFTPKTVETPELRTDLVYRLRVLVIDADEGLRQGMPVTVEIPGD
jgi:HlyD family secretion protein